MDSAKKQRIKNLILNKPGESTMISTGFEKNTSHKEGDVWEENGKTWTMNNGIVKNLSRLSKLRKKYTKPMYCPECGKPMTHRLDHKMWSIHNMCFECVTNMETDLRIQGKYEDYANSHVKNNITSFISDYEKAAEEYVENLDIKSFVTEQGDIENWSSGITKEELRNYFKQNIEQLKKQLLTKET